ncbi:MAG TPA: membrane dipeptidase [Terriglobia bacterium]|jgi:membrane dipeptidase|nr:membrane dipeptidase [Terriglobia bacterium]
MIVIDAHLDLAWNALGWNRDLTWDIREMRKAEVGMPDEHRGANTVSLSEMRRGEVAVCLATVLARASKLAEPNQAEPNIDFRTQEIAYAMGRGQVAYYRILEKQGLMKMLRNRRDLKAHMEKWSAGDDRTLPLGYILSMEGADPIVSPAQVEEWWDDGLRVVGLAHYGWSAYAHGTGGSGGLTAKGKDLLRVMQEARMILDATHLSDESFWEALELFHGPVLASHNNCRMLVPGDRQFTDDQIRELIKRDAVIGAAFDCWMLYPGWKLGVTPSNAVSMENVADHIDHICQLAGNARHVGIGSDLDGGFGREQSPHDLDTIADLQALSGILDKRGYSKSDIEGIMHGNWLRFFEKAWIEN